MLVSGLGLVTFVTEFQVLVLRSLRLLLVLLDGIVEYWSVYNHLELVLSLVLASQLQVFIVEVEHHALGLYLRHSIVFFGG